VLELGSFAGGITFEIAAAYPDLNLTIADAEPGLPASSTQRTVQPGLSGRVRLLDMNLDRLGV